MLLNEYDTGKSKFKLKITIDLVRNKTTIDQIVMQGSGNMVAFKIKGHWFLPQAGAFFSKIRKLLGYHQIEFVKSLFRIHGNDLSMSLSKKLKITEI